MKKAKKLTGILLLVAMLFMIAAPAMAVQTGTLTIKGTTAGKTYELYKVLDLTQSGDAYSYTVNEDFAGFSMETMDDKNLVEYIGTLTSDSDAISNLAQALVKYAIEKGISPADRVAANSATATATLDYGYYVMNPAGGSEAAGNYATMFSLNTLSGKNTVINVKAEYPTVDKQVQVDDENSASANAASIGDEITFTLTSKVPDLTGYKWYKFVAVDTLSAGLDYGEVKSITVGKSTLDASAYTVNESADGKTIRFILHDFVAARYTAGDTIVITYTATLNEQASVGTANDNTAKLEYSNDPSYTQNHDRDNNDFGDEPKGESESSKTETYTTSLTIHKVDGDGEPLAGAKFRITGDGVNKVVTTGDVFVEDETGAYWKLTDGTYTTTNPATEGIDQDKYDSTDIKYTKRTVTETIEKSETTNVEAYVDENGKLTFAGLGEGTYTISEIVTPDGYNSIPDFDITISFNADTEEFTLKNDNGDSLSSGKLLSMDVVNQTGSVLPSTGGIGTTIFYAVGGVLVVGAGVLLITRKRMSVEK